VILAAARIAGVERVFQIGGAMAVAAMAYGTESVPKVDKIVGPGNVFVALAKKYVFGDVGIDQVAGPTETLLIADSWANPVTVAADLLAQAEHDPMATPLLITDSVSLATEVQREVSRQAASLSRRDIAVQALQNRGAIIVLSSLEEAVEVANQFAPEHLCLLTRDPWALLPLVRNAGGVFLGDNSPEVMGDYVAGPSHIMPTGGSARFTSPIDVAHFVKRISVVGLSKEGFRKLAKEAIELAEAEGLTAHAKAVKLRLEAGQDGA
jgi:histidinol dehydrogenase